MQDASLHHAQLSVLYDLRRRITCRYSELRRSTAMESENFKFHLRKLLQLGFVVKLADGSYALTPAGKELANNLDKQKRGIQKQPKLSVVVIVPKPDLSGEYLFQKRFRQPFYGYWGCAGGPVQWGEDATETAARELMKQTGLTAEFEVKAFYRKRDYFVGTTDLLEDKLFMVVEARNVRGTLINTWTGGHNEWMSLEAFKNTARRFDSLLEMIEAIANKKTYLSATASYEDDEY